ncbi:MAG: transglycosylase domain-containing protein [Proteobacteria bacterium]|nr:transglycosylase domain-containing protein [Pseudomonadota bacterium]
MLKKFFIIASAFTVIAIGALLGGVYWLVVVEPGDEIRQDNIRRILGKESQVYYSDGTTKLGVFFDTAHRQYVTFEEIPKSFVNALVASEDERFFMHIGFDPLGIARAMFRNIQAGKIVQGGSTLTQQTAKNLFKRTDRSLQAKLKELIFALRLEYHYPKEKIFEFYANQFYVSGNGHGLGVAARYYFDKMPQELTLIECAFIAGSVKRPNFYNPFIKKTDQGADLAKSRGKARLEYVLGKMRDLGMISAGEYTESIAKDVQFTQGKVGYALDYAMELVREAVSSTDVLNALEANDVSNIATSGVKIITTLNRELQGKTLSILRGELSRLDVRLRGYERKEVQEELAGLDYSGDSVVNEGEFLFGTITEIRGKGKDIKIGVELDRKLGMGVIDAAGLSELVTARVKWQKNLWSEPAAGDQEQLVEQLQKRDRVWVSVRTIPEGQPPLFALEKYPQVQGGALVLKEGTIRGMAGGTENRFFNRAIQARRTMGSAFKPLVYTAALQLGWNSADMLLNRRNIFVLSGLPYFPRPDHKSPFDWVSMDWAGVHSENVATIWLLAHLCDQLTPLQFREVAENLGLAPKVIDGKEEPYRVYSTRIRDRYGIQVNREVLRAAAYRTALENLEADFIFDGLETEYMILKDLPFGLNFDKYTEDVEEEMRQKEDASTKAEIDEVAVRKKVLANRYVILQALREELAAFRSMFNKYGGGETESFLQGPSAGLYLNRINGEFSFWRPEEAPPYLIRMDGEKLRSHLQGLQPPETARFWQNIKLQDGISAGTFDTVEKQVDEEYRKLSNELPYSFKVLSQLEDFRITVGLHYLIQLAGQLGIKENLEPVLSFPLGSNVVTLLEATRMYEGLVTGKVTTFRESEQEEINDSLAIIDRIESEEGNVLYQANPTMKKVIDEKTALAIGGILENVVKFGTGKKANEKVRLRDDGQGVGAEIAKLNLPVPLLGKTGTANNYANASFFGYVPGVAEGGDAMILEDGYAVGVYVGFDNNLPMRRKSNRISGSAGALPTWCEIANVLLHEQEYAARLDPVDLSFNGLMIKRNELGQVNIGTAPNQGGLAIEPMQQISPAARSQQAILTFGAKSETGRFTAERSFQPFWKTAAENGRQ